MCDTITRIGYHRSEGYSSLHSSSSEVRRSAIIQPRGRPILRKDEQWRSQADVDVKLAGIPARANVVDIYELLQRYGNISKINIVADFRNAFVTFTPPPTEPFWEAGRLAWQSEGGRVRGMVSVDLAAARRIYTEESPVHPEKSYPQRVTLYADSVSFGYMHQETEMMVKRTIKSGLGHEVKLSLDIRQRELLIYFCMNSLTPDSKSSVRKRARCHYRINISFQQLRKIWTVDHEASQMEMVIPLESAPKFFRKIDISLSCGAGGRFWSEKSAWYRQTDDFNENPIMANTPFTLHKVNPVINIGHWTTYRLFLDTSRLDKAAYKTFRDALTDYNVDLVNLDHFQCISRTTPAFWEWLDASHERGHHDKSWILGMIDDNFHLPFSIRYQLEVCVSHGYINQYDITRDFIGRLSTVRESEAVSRLEWIAEKKQRVFRPMEIFDTHLPRSSLPAKIPSYCIYARTANITPSSIYFGSPSVETSNRVIRQYKEHQDRFLRVRFSDEKSEGKIYSCSDNTQDAVFDRFLQCLRNGIMIGDRHYEFLAFGNSQFRENGAYFFNSTRYLSAADIRAWMGNFDDIQTVAKYASRLGQCFSTTRAIHGTKVQVVEIEDVERNGYTFTDGVGKISKFLAQCISAELGLQKTSEDVPSVYQFRLGGCKGVVAISPEVGMREIHIRKSQYKFPAIHEGLEIIRCSSFATATLNRQLILIMQCLGVTESIILGKVEAMLQNLEIAMSNEDVALSMLQKQIDCNQSTLTIASIILDGFMITNDPFARSLLHLWRAWSMKLLKEKARIPIEEGAFLLGCTDETATLKGYFNHTAAEDGILQEDKVLGLPEIFVRVSNPAVKGSYKVIEGACIVARNPSLHPGDIRVVRAVNVPKLHHLKDVVVFAQTGDRDLPSMCSGGDLDGDDFIVIWDQSLIPQEWHHTPMDYKGPTPLKLNRVPTMDEVKNFFVEYMKGDTLSKIARAHLAIADYADTGAKDPRCLKLAELHSTAVDFVKTGIPACMSNDLYARKKPHFMANWRTPKDKRYNSKTVCGQIYDMVDTIDFHPLLHLPFDSRVLNAYEPTEELLTIASNIKREYDTAMRRIMAQHDIGTEFEVCTAFVIHHAQLSNDYKFHEEVARMASSLRERFRDLCYEKAGGKDWDSLAPFVVAMYTVTAREIQEFSHTVRSESVPPDESTFRSESVPPDESTRPDHTRRPADMPLISFPWIFQKELGKIAKGTQKESIVAQQAETQKQHSNQPVLLIDLEHGHDDIETTHGITHRGDLLALFSDGENQEIDANHKQDMFASNDITLRPIEHDEIASKHMHTTFTNANITLPPVDRQHSIESSAASSPTTLVGDDHTSEGSEDEDAGEIEIEIDDEPSALEKLASMLERTHTS